MTNSVSPAPEMLSVSASPSKPPRKKGSKIEINFIDGASTFSWPATGSCSVTAKLVHSGAEKIFSLPELAESFPDFVLQLAALGLSVRIRNAVNTSTEDGEFNPDAAEAAFFAMVDAIEAGKYHAGAARSLGIPLFLRAYIELLREGGKASEEKLSEIQTAWLTEYRADGRFENLPDEEASKALSKHQSAIRGKFAAPEIKKRMAEMSTRNSRPAASLEDLMKI